MNKAMLSLAGATLVMVSTGVFAGTCVTKLDSVRCTNTTYPNSLVSSTPVVLNHTTVMGKVKANGPLLVTKRSDIRGNTKVNGPLRVMNSVVQGKVKVNGPFIVKSAVFRSAVKVNSAKLKVFRTSIAELKVNGNGRVAKVCVMAGSKIGTLKFTKKGGVVYEDRSSSIGKVKGGRVVRTERCPIQ